MSIRRLIFLSAGPLLWASVACAQTAPPEPSAAIPRHGVERAPRNIAAWHKDMCSERYASEAGALAYLEARLDLTDKQRPAWNRWSQWSLDSAVHQRAACVDDTPKGSLRPTALEVDASHEKLLSIRLQGLQAARPALLDLYEALTPDQRRILDGAAHQRMGYADRRDQDR